MRRTVWIVNPYGTLPSEAWSTYRSTMLGERLAARGYSVTQFLSNFEHRGKTFRPDAPEGIDVAAGYRIELVPSTRYDRHISTGRVRYERTYARNLLAATAARDRPDFVVLAEPSLFYYDILLQPLLLQTRSGLVLDIIDIWPELFALVLPAVARRWAPTLLAPLYWWRKRLFRRADAVVAVAEDYIQMASRIVDPARVPLEVVYWSYDDQQVAGRATGPLAAMVEAKRPGEVWAVYAGTLGDNYDIPAILELGRTLPVALRPELQLKVLIAGDGPLAATCRAASTRDLCFLGRLAGPELTAVLRAADIALQTYRGESTVAMPIKAFDYLRYGLPIVNSLGRDIGRLVRDREVGLNYEAGHWPSLAAAVGRLARDPALRARMSLNARRLAEEFAPDKQYGRFADVLDRLPRRRAGGS
jgi:glycosyltransferase involved in cell wall biosynthesis